MKAIIPLLAGAAALPAQTPLAEAALIQDGRADKVWIEAASERTIRYREKAESLNRTDVPTREVAVTFFTPAEFTTAIDLYQNRQYEEAKAAFATAREKYAFVEDVPGNYSTLAGFYEIECARKLGQYEEMETLFAKFQPEPLRDATHKLQIRLYPLYNALRTDDWSRLQGLCEEYDEREVPGGLRAQIEYCRGMALDGQGQLEDALIAFNKAFVADYTASEVLTRKAALACLAIYQKHPDVELARKLHGKPEEDPNSKGAGLLLEAAALAEMWNKALGRGEALPPEYQEFLKYKKA
ncbi:hypothetical protein [Roseibacillus ishigakijimensis]|uniref:Tetratricopeptide repeat protein n=1 Tax=Roseibacillus ishigakijimensis TaxID=454146 RepID=A0A934RJ32_9BACT|nr:hypothetical protein [Roseibacillus ishigakijimensis]MBK1832567.1 hypothetical protein [Roseibacillus ishigakijimensis]